MLLGVEEGIPEGPPPGAPRECDAACGSQAEYGALRGAGPRGQLILSAG